MSPRGRGAGAPSTFLGSVDRALDSLSVTRRARFWVRLLRRVSPGGPAGYVSYLLSAVGDSCRYVLNGAANPVPRAGRALSLRLRDSGALLFVRPDTDDVVHALPAREQDVHDAILEGLGPGDNFVDVGANIGYYSVLAAMRVAPTGSVTAIEPVASTAAVLRRNIGANELGRVRIVEAAAGPAVLDRACVSFDMRHMGRATLQAAPGSAAQDVAVTTLDEICAPLERIALIKIDVEGAELGVLQGAARTLERTEAVVVECNEDGPAVESLLEARGFIVSRLRFTNHRLACKPPPRPVTAPGRPSPAT